MMRFILLTVLLQLSCVPPRLIIRQQLFDSQKDHFRERVIRVELFSLMRTFSPDELDSQVRHFPADWLARLSGLLKRGVQRFVLCNLCQAGFP
jgi:hypothetical protein